MALLSPPNFPLTAASFALRTISANLGMAMAARRPMMATVSMSSISVKPR